MPAEEPSNFLFEDTGFFRVFLNTMQEGVYFLDPERRIQYWNPAAERISGFEAAEVLGKCCADDILKHVDDAGANLCKDGCPMAGTIGDGKPRRARVYLSHKEGYRVAVDISCVQVLDSAGNVAGGLETFQEAVTLADADNPAMRCLTTGVPNRAFGEETLKRNLEEMRRQHFALGALFIAVDRVIHINDTYGKQVGDLALKMAARSLAAGLRPGDTLARWAGVEFLAILPRIKHIEAHGLAERLRMLVENSTRKLSNDRLRVTVSIGGCLCRPDDTAQSAINRLDRLVRESRARGGNQVTME